MVLQNTESFVLELFGSSLPSENFYHNTSHTKRVVDLATILATEEGCSDEEIFLVKLAAWFHDTGFLKTNEGHEEESVRIATDFLQKEGVNDSQLDLIKQLILVTKSDVVPKTKLEKIIKDADCGHLALEDFFDISQRLRLEESLKKGSDIEEFDWLIQNKEFLQTHRFYTIYAQQHWQPKKEINQYRLQQKIEKASIKKDKNSKENKFGRGVETLFRVQLKNHIELSAIADTKANILLSVNAIIISIALSNLIPKLDSPSNRFLVFPTLILMVFSVSSVVLSVISTRPKVSNVKVTRDMIKNKSTNILFFGNFYKMSLKEFEWGINHLIANEDTLYNSLTKDLYYLGLVLERKYRLLRVTYTVFMIGIIISALSFIISYYLNVSI